MEKSNSDDGDRKKDSESPLLPRALLEISSNRTMVANPWQDARQFELQAFPSLPPHQAARQFSMATSQRKKQIYHELETIH